VPYLLAEGDLAAHDAKWAETFGTATDDRQGTVRKGLMLSEGLKWWLAGAAYGAAAAGLYFLTIGFIWPGAALLFLVFAFGVARNLAFPSGVFIGWGLSWLAFFGVAWLGTCFPPGAVPGYGDRCPLYDPIFASILVAVGLGAILGLTALYRAERLRRA
jgi:hypothetical protein